MTDLADRLELPCDRARPAIRNPDWQRASGRIPPGCDLLAAYAVWIGKLAATRDVVIGTGGDTARAIALDPGEPFAALAARLAATPAVTGVAASPDPARHPRFDVGFGDGEPLGDLHLALRGGDFELAYDANLVSPDLAARLRRSLVHVLRTVALHPELPVGRIALASDAEIEEQVAEFSTPIFNWPRHLVLHELFEAKVDQAPDATALVLGETRVSYAELERRANAVAAALVDRGVTADSIVALVLDRSIEMIVAILGVLKAGGAYLPIEPDAPDDRIRYLLADSGAAAVLTSPVHAARIAHRHVVAVADVWDGPGERLPRRAEPHHLAYVIYTSGSTGQPKGVLVEHRNAVHFVLAEKADFAIRASDALILLSSYAFDASIDQIWLALGSGAKLVLVTKDQLLDPQGLAKLIAREQVSHLDSVPALLAELSPMLPSIRQVVVGGEACPVAIARAWCRSTRFWNEYGPTETTVGSLRHLVDPEREIGGRVPIGRPIGATRAYVLDWGGCHVPPGVRGELYLGGAGVTRGYLQRDELTRERFVADPHAEPGARMYRTGDVVAWLPDGSIEFFGRVDSQVKLRGFRIELGEIEAALQRHPDVSGAAATVHAGARLVAHLVASRPVAASELRAFLAASLPAYMVPDFFVQLDAFPTTVSGKIDRKALPPPRLEGGDIEPPKNQVEHQLRAIWAQLLALPAEQIGVTRSFFELGGHSLLVMQMLSRVQAQLGVALRPADVLAHPTIREIAAAIAGAERSAPLPRADATLALPATSVQRRLYVIQQGNPRSTSYNLPLLYAVEGELDEAELAAACAQLIERHESLRTAFFFQEGQILQKIAQAPRWKLERFSLDAQSLEAATAAFVRPFALEAPPLFRAAVFVRGGAITHVAFDMHHIISDGTSIDVLLEDLLDLLDGRTLPELGPRFFDYSAWLASPAGKARLAASRDHWTKLLADEPPLLDLPYDVRRPQTRNQAADEISLELPASLVERVARFARERQATPFGFFAAVYSAFLSATTGSAEVIWGFPTAGRPHAELERTVGMFVNTLVFRATLDPAHTFDELLGAAMAQVREALRNEDLPFEDMVADLPPPPPGRNPLFDTMLSYEGRMPDEYRAGDAVLRERALPHRFARTDLTVVIRERGAGGYWLRLEYSADLFRRATAERLAAELVGMIERVLAEPSVRLADLHACDAAERERLVHGWNATAHALPPVAAVHELFERHARERPDATAVELGELALSYAEVDARANQLARVLRGKGVGKDAIVGILLDPCADMLIAVLGVMKAGGGFLPIDPDYPLARKLHMLRDSATRVLLTRGALAAELGAVAVERVQLDDPAVLAGISSEPVDARVAPGDLAYVIYTSGSTGTPKGTLIEHRNLVNFAAWYADYFRIAPGDGVSKYAGFGFDASIAELVPCFISGARLVIVPAELRLQLDELDGYFADHRVAVAFLPTQYGEQFLRAATRHQLRAAFLGGEKLRSRPTERCAIVNGYGPTEYTVAATAFTVDRAYDNIPIGAPLWNTQVLVLDRLGRVCPVGVAGELCIAGASIARGYLNRPELTAEKFVPHPFEPGRRMYRSGDLARWRDDGNLEFLGRIDTQVKVRGFRIELGEIEQALLALPGVEAAVAVARENPAVAGDLSLVAFVQASGTTQAATEGDLKLALGGTLPAYMVPARIVQLDAIPLTANGKVDKRRLPPVELDTAALVEPRSARERELRAIYADVLGRPEPTISVEASFLELGGHSLKAAVLLSAIFQRTGVQLRFARFLEGSSIAAIARAIDAASEPVREAPRWEPAPPGPLPLTASQQRIFAVHQLSTWSTAYNIPFAWELAPGVDPDRLARALEQLVARHAALRAAFTIEDGVPQQRFDDTARLAVQRLEVEDANLRGALEHLVQPFELARPPLVRAAILRSETRQVLALDVHHIVADGLSVRLLLDDLEQLYDGKALPPPSPTFADYASWEASEAGRAAKQAERAWWLERFTELPSPLELPCDFDRPPRLQFDGDEVAFDLPIETAKPLLELARTCAITPLGVFLAVWAVAVSRLGNSPDLVIGIPASGRQKGGMDGMVGMFVNTVPLRVRLDADETFAALCARLGREAVDAFEHQSYQLNDLVADLGLARDPSRNPLFDVLFAWQEAELAEIAGGSLGLVELPSAAISSKFDLELTVQNTARGQRVVLTYATRLFKEATAERFLGNFRRLLEQVASMPQARIRELRMLQPWEREILLSEYNDTAEPMPQDVTLADLVAAHVLVRPHAIAVEDETGAYDFAELDRRASVLAAELVARGTVADDVVAIAMHRTKDVAVAMLAAWKAGAGYLPIDPEAPDERVAGIIADSRARVFVSQAGAYGLPGVLAWDAIDWARTPPPSPSPARAEHVAYVIYTSGSTGKPKGVVIEHRQIVNYLLSTINELRVDSDDRILLFSSYTFDASLAQLGLPLVSGARLVVATKQLLLDLDALEAFMRARGITHFHSVPLFLSGFRPEQPLALRRVVVGGDVLPLAVAERWSERQPLYNEYGPTETTVTSLRHAIGKADLARARLPVGFPLANTTIYILDWTGNLAPLGVPGEMYIGGLGVARGYLNNPELTAQRFLPNPWGPGERMYRTGDLARWLPDGAVDFLGRADNQIKIRGFRVELGEIEAALLRHPAVAEAVVAVVPRLPGADGPGSAPGAEIDKRLCGYVRLRDATPTSALRTFLARTLPSYMVPDAFVALDAFPVTISGKVDRKQLPAPSFDDTGTVDAPESIAEEKLIEIWAEVLRVPAYRIPVTRSFFELGGHSLLIMQLIARIQHTFSVRLATTDVFEHPTVRGLAGLIEAHDRTALPPIPKVSERDHYPLTSVQRRLYAIHQASPESVSYNMPSVFSVEGRVTPERLEEVVRALIARHASLRSSFHLIDGEPAMRIHPSAAFALQVIDSDAPIDELMQRLMQPFDLAVAPLWRVWLVRRSQGAELLVLDMHHMIADGFSTAILWREIPELIRGAKLAPPRITIGDFAVWQASPEHRSSLDQQRAFWKAQFATIPPPLELPYDVRHPAVRSHAGDLVVAQLDRAELAALSELARGQDSTLFATLLACWFVFLSRIGGSDDVVVGVPVAGRSHPDVQDLVGMFVNTVPWRAKIPETGTFREFLAATRKTSQGVLASDEYQLEDLLDELGVRAAAGRNPLFDVMFSFNSRGSEVIDAGAVKLRAEQFAHRTAKMDLLLVASETDDGVELAFEYATELFERATVERLAGWFVTLIRGVLAGPERPIAELEIITPAEKQRFLVELNATAHALPPVASVLHVFEDWVQRAPDAPGVVFGDTTWSYREVDRRANWIARWLVERGVGRDDVVPLLLDPCAEQLSAILGILKAGAAFLPIDYEYPTGRKQIIVDDCRAKVLLARGALADAIAFEGPRLDVAVAGHADAAPGAEIRPGDAAYVIYTSGSTGKPKGVVIEHRNLLNLTAWFCAYNAVEPGEACSKYAGFSFDASISELFPPIFAGGALVVIPAELRLDLKALNAYLEAHRVRIAFLPTQLGEQFIRTIDNRTIRMLALGGEKLRAYRPVPYKIVNAYGPSEYTVYTTAFTVDRSYDNIPIGKPIWNTQIVILDRGGRLCPTGIVGELCVAGANIARGYLNRPELTAERFVAHPFEPGGRMYRTGDLARWLPDGNLEYLGRIDTQVKVRGYRIELGEIEQALLAVPGIRDAVVVDARDEAGVVHLVGYHVGELDDHARIRAALARDLPEYMIPTWLCRLDALPLTPNGKVDKRALPAIERAAGVVEAPVDDRERALAAMFANVLALDVARIGRTASFFELGGHSLKAIALVGEIFRQFHCELKVSDVFRHPTVQALARRLAELGGADVLGAIEPVAPTGPIAASSVQARMFLLQQMEPASTTYNVPNLFAVAPGVARGDLERALAALVRRHDAFRCAFALDGSEVQLRLAPDAELVVDTIATRESERDAVVDGLVRPFELGTAPLARAAWLTTERGSYLFLDVHHIIADGVSLAILIDELHALLAGEPLPPAPPSLADCTAWERGERATAVIDAQRGYWRGQFEDGVPTLGLVTDLPRPPVVDPAGETIVRELPDETVRGLRALCQRHGLSMHALLLAAFDVLLARLTRQSEIAVATAASGRWHPDMQRVVGMFVNTLVLANTVDPKQPFRDFAAEVARRSIEALDNQAFPFAELVELVGDGRHAGHTPLVDVMFAMQNADERFERDAALLSPVAVDTTTAKF
ncbi:MAG TPA: amino acid adenylation domain-containing protein, partial [Kofleriaceae bacterium]|nr:amino acid adenylation domain-containing protein [Kofleriaceae bacterium]